MKFIRLKLSLKFTLLVISIVLLFGSINIFLIYRGIRSALTTELEKRIVALGRTLAADSLTPLLYEDIMNLQSLVDNMLSMNPDISYTFILDQNRHVLVHTFEDSFPEDLLTVHENNDVGEFQIRTIRSKDEVFHDIALPIMSGELGTVRLGVKLSSTQQQITKITYRFLIMVILFLIAGIVGAVIMARFITRPIYKIVEVAENFDIQSPPKKVKPFARDEIGYLTIKFNQLSQRLHSIYQQLQESQQMLIQTEKMAALGVMAAGIAHEINNPLTGLQNSIRRILNAPTDKQQIKRYKPLIKDSLKHIAEIIQNLLWFAHQKEDLNEQVNLNDCVERALLLIAYRLEKNRISVQKDGINQPAFVKGNAQHLQQVILNIILNAVDAMPEGGTLKISCSRVNHNVQLTISDTGTGIAPEYLEKIFDPFFTTKTVGEGTGLGLSVSYQIIQNHGGQILCDSLSSGGAIFTILLPIDEE